MITNYDPFIDRVIKRYEGPYGWNRKDPGGPTKYGITCYDLAEHRGQSMNSMSAWASPVAGMPLSEAEDIYAMKYANGIRFNSLPSGPDCCMLDYGINSGLARPIRVGRAILGLGSGGMDNDFVHACLAYDAKKFVDTMCAERLRFMHAIRGGSAWEEFGRGWGSRVEDVQAYSDHLVSRVSPHPGEGPDLSNVPTPKAKHTPINKPSTTAGTTTGGAIATGAAAHAAGFSWEVVAGLLAASFVGGVAYEIWQKHRANVANNIVHLPVQVVPSPNIGRT